jgi:hypothetical protein
MLRFCEGKVVHHREGNSEREEEGKKVLEVRILTGVPKVQPEKEEENQRRRNHQFAQTKLEKRTRSKATSWGFPTPFSCSWRCSTA